jgi:UV DNA damage endonuclease
LLRLDQVARRKKLSQLCLGNALSLLAALQFCSRHGIGSFRIPSWILPVKTHPEVGYDVIELPDSGKIISAFQQCGEFVIQHGLRTTFHPDQFVVLNSPNGSIVAMSLVELEYHAQVADWVHADVINIHAGGAYGDKKASLARFARNLDLLSHSARSRMTVENDDTVFSPRDLLPICKATGIPLVYDVHHHRCLPDGLSVEAATRHAVRSWDREPLFHISSPVCGWGGRMPRQHHEYINRRDVPKCWRSLAITIEVEAKAKELAVLRLMRGIKGQRLTISRRKSIAKQRR